MKKSLMLAAAILALGVAPGFFQRNRLTALREDHRKLVAEAVKLGLPAEPGGDASEPRLTKRQREEQEKKSRLTAAEVIAFAKDMEALEKSGGSRGDEAFQKRAMEMMARLTELDSAQLKRVVKELRDNPDISAEARRNIISFSILMLSDDHPEAALSIYTESADLLDKGKMSGYVISSALGRWAELSPEAALDWLRRNSDKLPAVSSDEAKHGVISGIAANDPKLAFKVLGELNLEDPMTAVQAVLMSGHESPEQRNAVLTALREHLAGIGDETQREEAGANALEVFARTADKEGFDTLTKWMVDAKFTPLEKQQFAGGLSYFTTKQDTGRWVEWLAGNLPAENLRDPVRELVGEWTQQDYLSAGKWLSAAPEGPARTAAVEAYAETVAEYEPQVAAQWALTLPPGPGRDSTLRAIHQNWPAGDPEGAAKFAREHGLE